MIPLPHAAQLLAVEILVAIVGRKAPLPNGRGLGVGLRLKPCPRRAPQVTGQTHHRPAVLPRHRHQAHGAPDAVEILHEERPPRAIGSLHDAALVSVAARRGILVHGPEGELRAVLADAILRAAGHLRERGGVVAVGLVGRDHACLVRTIYIVRARAQCAPVGLIVGGDKIVFAFNLIHVVPLAYPVAFGDDDTLGALHGAAHIGFQLRAFYFAVAVDGINLAVVVEEHTQVIDIALHVVVCPGAADVLAGVALQALAIDVGEDIKLAVGIAYAGCPDALTVDFLVVLQREGIVGEVEAVEAVADVLPVHQILGMQDDQAGHGVHRGAGQIVVIAHPKDVRVGELIIEQGVREGAVAVVGSPGLCLCRAHIQ